MPHFCLLFLPHLTQFLCPWSRCDQEVRGLTYLRYAIITWLVTGMCLKPPGVLYEHKRLVNLGLWNSSKHFYRAHTKYDAKVMFSAFLSFCQQGWYSVRECSYPEGGGGIHDEVPIMHCYLQSAHLFSKGRTEGCAYVYIVKLQGILGKYPLPPPGHEHFVCNRT